MFIHCNAKKYSPHVSAPQGEAAPTSLSKAPLSAVVDVCATWDGANAVAAEAIARIAQVVFIVAIDIESSRYYGRWLCQSKI